MYQNPDYNNDSDTMIKTNTDITINCEALLEQLDDQLTQQISLDSDWQINCYQEDDWLIILIDLETTENIETVIELIKTNIKESQIVSDFIITSREKIYFATQEDYPAEIINRILDMNGEFLTPTKKYSSANFSSGLIIFVLSALSFTALGIFSYFSRPCVMVDKCDLITTTNSSISQTLTNQPQTDLTESNLQDLQTELTTAIEQLNRIPRWSSYHQESSQLISQYRQIIQDINYLLAAKKLVNNADNMSQKLPLSLDEWNRVKSFLEDAIAKLNLISTPDLAEEKQAKIDNYNQKILLVNQKIATEKIAQDKLFTAEAIVQEIKSNQNSLNSIADLEKLEQQWQNAIVEIESIPADTVSAKNKEDLLNSHLKEIINIQTKITTEKEAYKLFTIAQESIKLAEESEQANQFTKAISFWQKALDSLKNISLDSLLKEEVTSLNQTTQERLDSAKQAVNDAIQSEKIKQELETICAGIENICTYKIDKKKIEIFLTQQYFNKIASLYRLENQGDNLAKKQKLSQHIDQVQNNYQYLSKKYNLPVRIYNYNQKLIMIYN
jgi:hypothetical protein